MTSTVRILIVLQSVLPASLAAQEPIDTTRTFVLELTSVVYANTRAVRVHLPPGYHDPQNAQAMYPVLMMGDGFAVFSARSWNGPAVLDSLANAGLIRPFILVGIDNAASIAGIANPGQARAREYLPYTDSLQPEIADPQGKLYPDMLWNEVLPLVQSRFRVAVGRDNVVIGGSSLSALATLWTYIVSSNRVGGVLLESPPVFMFGERLTADLGSAARPSTRFYVGIGTAETPDSVILKRGAEAIRRLVNVADATGATTRFLEVDGATHNSQAWRARLPEALQFLFPPPTAEKN